MNCFYLNDKNDKRSNENEHMCNNIYTYKRSFLVLTWRDVRGFPIYSLLKVQCLNKICAYSMNTLWKNTRYISFSWIILIRIILHRIILYRILLFRPNFTFYRRINEISNIIISYIRRRLRRCRKCKLSNVRLMISRV